MSRKKRNKKKKQKIQKKIEKLSIIEKTIEKPKAIETDKVQTTKETRELTIINEETEKLISKDVKAILLTVLLLTAILIGVKFLQLKTDLIDNFGNWLIKILNIHTT